VEIYDENLNNQLFIATYIICMNTYLLIFQNKKNVIFSKY
jgi:hypothetical protein